MKTNSWCTLINESLRHFVTRIDDKVTEKIIPGSHKISDLDQDKKTDFKRTLIA
jgi:hypothetical protein